LFTVSTFHLWWPLNSRFNELASSVKCFVQYAVTAVVLTASFSAYASSIWLIFMDRVTEFQC